MLNSPAAFFADNRLCYKDGPLHAIFRLQARLKPAVIDVFQARSDRDCVAFPDSCFHFTRILFTLRFGPTDNGCRFSARLSFASTSNRGRGSHLAEMKREGAEMK